MSTSYSKVEYSKADIKVKSDLIAIDNRIEHIDVKGQYIQLAAPIHLSGQINAAKLSMEYKIPEQQINITENSDELVLKIGVDEAGRGPLLGSVHVAAAILPQAWSGLIEERPLNDTPLSILTDSKQLSEKKRDILYPLIKEHAIGYVVADIPAAVIDQINILQATMLGMRLCAEVLLEAIAGQVLQAPQSVFSSFNIETQILYDGNRCPDLDYSKLTKSGIDKAKIDCQAWVKGDARHTSIAAASILAKVSRDQTMYALDERHPQYAIAKHKGYPTKGHMEAINNYGVLPEHRRSFGPIKKALGNNLS